MGTKNNQLTKRELKNQKKWAWKFFRMINFTFFKGKLVLNRFSYKINKSGHKIYFDRRKTCGGFYSHGKDKEIIIKPSHFFGRIIIHEIAHLITMQSDKRIYGNHRKTFQKNLIWIWEIFLSYESQRYNGEVRNGTFPVFDGFRQ